MKPGEHMNAMRRDLVVGLMVLACTVHAVVPAVAGPKPPHVLFIAVDDLKPMLGCYGDDTVQTPHIDRLASRGTVFLNAHCQQAVCGPSRASLLTGLRPDRTRVWDLKTKIRDENPEVVTLPQYFKQHGYTSVGTGKVFDFRSVEGHTRDDPASWSRPYVVFPSNPDAEFGVLNKAFVERVRKLKADGVKSAELKNALGGTPPVEIDQDVPDSAYDDGSIADTGIKLLAELAAGEEPFFLAVGFKKPHLPFVAPKKYADLYDRNQFKPHPVKQRPEGAPPYHWQPGWELRNGSYSGVPPIDDASPIPDDMQVTLIHGYHACVSYVDAQIGRLLDALNDSGQADHTIVVLWGDHGWHLGDHGMWCKHTNYEQATRSPLIIADLRRAPAGRPAPAPVEFLDIYPTLCDLAGLPVPEVLQGVSLVPILDDPAASVKPVAVSQYPRHVGDGEAMGYAYRDPRYRYIEWVRKDYRAGDRTGDVVDREFYDYQTDPLETRNLVDDPRYADEVARMKQIAASFHGSQLHENNR